MVSASVFDAVNGIKPRYESLHVPPKAPGYASQRAAAIQAAYAMLIKLYPTQTGSLTPKRDASIAAITTAENLKSIQAGTLLGLGLTAGIFVGWTVYLIAAEEMHWRIHMDGWLPWGLGFARAYHMSHHDTPNIRYNVFLPLFDFLLGNSRLPTRPRYRYTS